MTAVLPAPVAELKQRYDELSEANKLLLAEVIRSEKEAAETADMPWPWDVLDERQKALDEGRSKLVPLEDFKRLVLERRDKSA